uniref:Protein BCCIP homolog n=1 Tax=Globodera rostochiensis TaxID=31243 RepID=A0A914H583_GLORO
MIDQNLVEFRAFENIDVCGGRHCIIFENVCGDGEEGRKEEEEDSDIVEEDESMSEVEDNPTEEMTKLHFEFEALPPAEDDLEDIERLLTQIFLQADIDKQELAKVVADQSPLGCVFRPVEECEDEEIEAITYGVLSIVPLSGTKKFQSDVAEFILHRSKKHSIGEISRIAGPAFHSLDADYKSLPEEERFEHILVVLKVRICTEQGSSASSSQNVGKKPKLGKAARKRLAADGTAESDIIFDNPEEQLLFERTFDFPHFQYPVESEIEKTSKFHSIQRGGRTYRPFRRVCLLNNDQFLAFAASVTRSYTD